MKKGISFKKRISADSKWIYQDYYVNGRLSTDMNIRYSSDIEEYKHSFLSWDNLSYSFPTPFEDEEDDYLLEEALQKSLKTALCIYTKNVSKITDHFANSDYLIHVKKARGEGYHYVYIVRQGTLADYFNIDEIYDLYDAHGIIHFNDGIWEDLCNTEMINLVNDSKESSLKDGVFFDPIMDVALGDDITNWFGPAGAAVAGLLFGYPIESTVALLTCCPITFKQ